MKNTNIETPAAEETPVKKPSKPGKIKNIGLPVVSKVYNYDKPTTFDKNSKPLRPVEALGYSLVNNETGEVLSERPNWFFPAERVGSPFHEVEVGAPLMVTFRRSRDIKENLKRLYGDNKEKMLKALYCEYDPEEEKQALIDMQEDGLTYEEDAINRLSSQSPYFVGDDGLTGFERMIKEEGLEVEAARKWQSMKDIVPKEWHDMSIDDIKTTLDDLLSKAQTNNPQDVPPTHPEE